MGHKPIRAIIHHHIPGTDVSLSDKLNCGVMWGWTTGWLVMWSWMTGWGWNLWWTATMWGWTLWRPVIWCPSASRCHKKWQPWCDVNSYGVLRWVMIMVCGFKMPKNTPWMVFPKFDIFRKNPNMQCHIRCHSSYENGKSSLEGSIHGLQVKLGIIFGQSPCLIVPQQSRTDVFCLEVMVEGRLTAYGTLVNSQHLRSVVAR